MRAPALPLLLSLLIPSLGSCRDGKVPLLVCQKGCAPRPKLTARAVRVRAAGVLLGFRQGTTYKFVVDARGRLLVAPLAKKVKGNPYHHPVLAGGRPVRTAGEIVVGSDGREVTRVTLNQRSYAYCPPFETLNQVKPILLEGGIRRRAIRLEDRPPGCTPRWQEGTRGGK